MIKTAIAFMFGCVLFLQLNFLPEPVWFWIILPTVILLFFTKARILAYLLFGILWTFCSVQGEIDSRLTAELEGQDIRLSGTIASIPERNSNRIRFIFKPNKNHYSLPNKIRLNWYKPLPIEINANEQWQLTVRLKQIHGMSNPGGFDYEAWLFQQGIGATGYVRSSSNNTKLATASVYSINSLRQALMNKLELYLAESPNLGLIEGLMTGIRHNINPQQWQILSTTGTSHLLAISGLHIGLAGAIGFICFQWIWLLRPKNLLLIPASEFSAIGSLLAALFYAALAGFSIPTQRALIMLIVLLIGILSRQPVIASSLLAASMLIVLLLDPIAVLSIGFWLSFSAVGLILYLTNHRFPSPRWQWLKIHGLLALGLSPLLLLFFLQTSVISPIANLIAIPFISFIIVPLLLLASVMLWLFEPLGAILLHTADYLLSLTWPLLDYLANISFSTYSITPLPFYYFIPIITGMVLLLSPRGFPAKWIGLVGFVPLLLFTPTKPNDSEFWFSLLDVGQGLSAVVQTSNHILVFDTGAKFSPQFNMGSAVLTPYLRHQGIRAIDKLIISHGDNDHIGGAIPLMAIIPTEQVISSTTDRLPESIPCYQQKPWQWDGVNFEILYPSKNDIGSENNLSCVLRVSSQHGSVLLTGDIELLAESRLVQRYHDRLSSTVMLAPHHGSKTSSSLQFINTVSPKIVLIPSGYRNRYHFPHKKVVSRYKTNGIPIFTTAEHGAMTIKFEEGTIPTVSSWRHIDRKIWSASQ